MKRNISIDFRSALLITAAMVVAPFALAGTLRIVPRVQEGQVVVPVMLEGDTSTGVAALDFYLDYDPAVLEPAGITAGSAAVSAGKQVLSNMTTPGRYKVILFGVNQNVVNTGEVARVTLRTKGEPSDGRTDLKVTGTHLASVEGLEMPSSGSSETLVFGDESSEDGDEEQNEDGESEGEAEGESDADGDSSDDSAETATGDPESPAGPTPTRTSADATNASSPTPSGTARPPVSAMPPLEPTGAGESGQALARLERMRDETRRLRERIQSPATVATAEPDAGASSADSPDGPDKTPTAEVPQPATPQVRDTPGASPSAPTAARPVNAASLEPAPTASPQRTGTRTASRQAAAARRTRMLTGAVLAAMGCVAVGLMVVRRRLFS